MIGEVFAEAFTKQELEEMERESAIMIAEMFHLLNTHPEWTIT